MHCTSLRTSRLSGLLLIATCAFTAHAEFDLGYGDDSDLTAFISRPELRIPKFEVNVSDPSRVTPGYWFVAPYFSLIQDKKARNYYQPCQTGPAIYDGAGELVWTGACLFGNQNTCDFRAFHANGSDHLSAIIYNHSENEKVKGHGVILDESYQITHHVNVSKTLRNMNMHEMNVIMEGTRALHIIHRSTWTDLTELEEFGISDEAGWVSESGFREVEVDTGKVLFEWWALDHVSLTESSSKIEGLEGPPPGGWNFFHMNSVDKNADGDYMISARFTDCIYKISKTDGSIIWRLGGDQSSFVLDGFNFSKQHDARFIEETNETTVISLLDNASNGINMTSEVSTGMLVALETTANPMKAKLLQRWTRPDGALSHLRGNFQMLPNRNFFAGWSDNSYVSEHTYEGDVVMTARWASERFVTYRAWKYNFTGAPAHPPDLKIYAFGVDADSSTTVGYVSWNGATEVAAWEVFSNSTSGDTSLARLKKDGFETMFQIQGYHPSLYVQGLSITNQVLGRSPVSVTEKPRAW